MKTIKSGACPLAILRDGQSGYIHTVEIKGLLRRRILDLGMLPGTRVECVRRSPSGNPIAYEVRGATIALRREDAAHIQIFLK